MAWHASRIPFTLLQIVHSLKNGLPGGGALKRDDPEQMRQEFPNPRVLSGQFLIIDVIGRPNEHVHLVDGRFQGLAVQGLENRRAQCGILKGGIEDQPTDLHHLDRRGIQILHRSQPGFVTGVSGFAEHLCDEQIEEIQGVIQCGGFEYTGKGDQRRQPTCFQQSSHDIDLGRVGHSGEGTGDAQVADVGDAIQRADQLGHTPPIRVFA